MLNVACIRLPCMKIWFIEENEAKVYMNTPILVPYLVLEFLLFNLDA